MGPSLNRIQIAIGFTVWIAIILPQLAWGGTASVDAAPPSRGSFDAQWSVEGSQSKLDFAGVNSFAIFQHTGTVTVQRDSGFVANAMTKCIGLRDAREGSVSRCVWITASGDQIFSELTNEIEGAQARSGPGQGQIVGGTGRYQGISGTYKLRWVNKLELNQRTIEGKTLSMQGEWKLPTATKKTGDS